MKPIDVGGLPYPEFIRYIDFMTNPDKDKGEKFIHGGQSQEELEAQLESIKQRNKALVDKVKNKA